MKVKNENTKFTYLNNNNSIKINNDVNVISPYIPESSQGKKSSKEKQSKIISKIDETIFDNSVSVKSVNKSPYYFNDPKYAKLMEIKKKYNKSINLNTSNNNNNLSNSLGNVVNKKDNNQDINKFNLDQNNDISEEDIEILKNISEINKGSKDNLK